MEVPSAKTMAENLSSHYGKEAYPLIMIALLTISECHAAMLEFLTNMCPIGFSLMGWYDSVVVNVLTCFTAKQFSSDAIEEQIRHGGDCPNRAGPIQEVHRISKLCSQLLATMRGIEAEFNNGLCGWSFTKTREYFRVAKCLAVQLERGAPITPGGVKQVEHQVKTMRALCVHRELEHEAARTIQALERAITLAKEYANAFQELMRMFSLINTVMRRASYSDEQYCKLFPCDLSHKSHLDAIWVGADSVLQGFVESYRSVNNNCEPSLALNTGPPTHRALVYAIVTLFNTMHRYTSERSNKDAAMVLVLDLLIRHWLPKLPAWFEHAYLAIQMHPDIEKRRWLNEGPDAHGKHLQKAQTAAQECGYLSLGKFDDAPFEAGLFFARINDQELHTEGHEIAEELGMERLYNFFLAFAAHSQPSSMPTNVKKLMIKYLALLSDIISGMAVTKEEVAFKATISSCMKQLQAQCDMSARRGKQTQCTMPKWRKQQIMGKIGKRRSLRHRNTKRIKTH